MVFKHVNSFSKTVQVNNVYVNRWQPQQQAAPKIRGGGTNWAMLGGLFFGLAQGIGGAMQTRQTQAPVQPQQTGPSAEEKAAKQKAELQKAADVYGYTIVDNNGEYTALKAGEEPIKGDFATVINGMAAKNVKPSEKQQAQAKEVAQIREQAIAEGLVDGASAVLESERQPENLDNGVAGAAQELEQEPETPDEGNNSIQSTKYKVNYQDTWYGIVQAKYGITDHKQTMEIVHQLKAQNNVSNRATNIPSEIDLPNTVTLKDGTEVALKDINAEVDKSHFGYKTTSKTGRYTVTQNGKTRYYAADGTELKQSYYEAVEASKDQRNYSENGSGRYTYTASNGETWYFAADGTAIKEEYYNRRETEYTAVKSQKTTLANARGAFEQQKASDGWAGKTADAVSVLWGSDNRAVKVEADLKTYEQQVAALQKAQSQGATQFNAKFKEIYGVDYNPANVAAYEANPTDENYRKAYGTKNNIHKRVMDYNKSQQDGAAAVKTTVVVVGTAAAAVATGGASLAATAAVAGVSTAAARTIVEVTDLATNDIDGDVNMENLNSIAEQAMVEGVIAGATAGIMKGGSGLIGKAGTKVAPKNAPTSAEKGLVVRSNPTSEAVVVRSNPASEAVVVRPNTATSAGSASAKGASSAAKGAGTSARGANSTGSQGASGAKTGTGATANGATSASNNAAFAKSMSAKISSRGGLNNLTAAEKSKLSQIIGKNVDELKNLPKSEIRKLQIKFHPDKNPNNVEFAQDMFGILSNLIK